MESFFAFAKAALPWVAVGLLIAVFCARAEGKKKREETKEEKPDNYGTEGMCLGMCFGTALGTALGNNTGVGLSLGMLLGLAIGSCIPRGRKDADE